jgi:hypothetical protein
MSWNINVNYHCQASITFNGIFGKFSVASIEERALHRDVCDAIHMGILNSLASGTTPNYPTNMTVCTSEVFSRSQSNKQSGSSIPLYCLHF